jgi:hypothetical protein
VGITSTVTGAGLAVVELGGLRAAAGGLLGMFGGPWGLAITGSRSDEGTKRVTEATKSYADALERSKGAIDSNVRSAAAKSAQDSGLLDVAKKPGHRTAHGHRCHHRARAPR